MISGTKISCVCFTFYYFTDSTFSVFQGPKLLAANSMRTNHKLERLCQTNRCQSAMLLFVQWRKIQCQEEFFAIPFSREIYEPFQVKQTQSKKRASNNLNTLLQNKKFFYQIKRMVCLFITYCDKLKPSKLFLNLKIWNILVKKTFLKLVLLLRMSGRFPD